MIALYNAALSATLAFGASWLPHHRSKRMPIHQAIIGAMMVTALIFAAMIIFQHPITMFLFFAFIGFSITRVTTTMTIHISNMSHTAIQGEVMGTQVSLRTLGDAIICIAGSFLIVASLILPIVFCCIIALYAAILCMVYLKPAGVTNHKYLRLTRVLHY